VYLGSGLSGRQASVYIDAAFLAGLMDRAVKEVVFDYVDLFVRAAKISSSRANKRNQFVLDHL